MIFRFVVRRLRWLARVPFLPHFFDAALLLWTAVFHQQRLRAIDLVLATAEGTPEFRRSVHRFGGTGFKCGSQEIAHVHGNGLLDAHVGRANADALVRGGAAEPHHVFGPSAWVSFWIRCGEDVPRALELLKLAHDQVRSDSAAGGA